MIDLQKDPRVLLHADFNFPPNQTPGLKAAVRRILGLELDKTEQRSDWGVRPLRAGQLKYAALDSEILLRLWERLGGG